MPKLEPTLPISDGHGNIQRIPTSMYAKLLKLRKAGGQKLNVDVDCLDYSPGYVERLAIPVSQFYQRMKKRKVLQTKPVQSPPNMPSPRARERSKSVLLSPRSNACSPLSSPTSISLEETDTPFSPPERYLSFSFSSPGPSSHRRVSNSPDMPFHQLEASSNKKLSHTKDDEPNANENQTTVKTRKLG